MSPFTVRISPLTESSMEDEDEEVSVTTPLSSGENRENDRVTPPSVFRICECSCRLERATHSIKS